MSDNDFTDDMEELAADIAIKAGGDIPLNDKIDAFKALMPFYAIKMKSKPPAAEPDTPVELMDFNSFRKHIHAEDEHGSNESGVRGRRRNGN